jgi:hypothetical protein
MTIATFVGAAVFRVLFSRNSFPRQPMGAVAPQAFGATKQSPPIVLFLPGDRPGTAVLWKEKSSLGGKHVNATALSRTLYSSLPLADRQLRPQ